MINRPGVYFPQSSTRGQYRSVLSCCRSYKEQQGALLYKPFRKGDRRGRECFFFFFLLPLTSQSDFIIHHVAIIPGEIIK